MQAQIFNTVIPLTISALALLPFVCIPSLRHKDKYIKQLTYNSMFCYLICLGFTIVGLITVEATIVMGYHSSVRAIFISTILLVACIDKAIDLIPQMIFIKANLIRRLAYFVNILCSVPLIWQILLCTVPKAFADNLKLMEVTQILLMLIMLALGIVNRPTNKKIQEQNS